MSKVRPPWLWQPLVSLLQSTEKTLDFVLFIMHSVFLPRGCSIPLAFIGAPMSHQMSHWDQPDTICSDNSLPAARQGQLEDYSAAMVNCRACTPVTFAVWPAHRFRRKNKNSEEEFAQSVLQQHNLCFKYLMATKQTTGSDGVIGSAVIPEWFSHAVLRRGLSF